MSRIKYMASVNDEKIQKGSRIFHPNNFYHVYNRGNHKEKIFYQEDDYLKFLDMVRFSESYTGVEIYGYCLMPNHYHLLLRLGSDPIMMSKFFHRSMTGYVLYFNHKYNKVGHLFQDRYQYRLLEGDRDIRNIKRYFKDNPLEAGLVRDSSDYRWLHIYEG